MDSVVSNAQKVEEEGRLVESLNLADAALAVDPDHAGALKVRVSVLRTLGRAEKNFNARNWINYSRRQSEQRLAALE